MQPVFQYNLTYTWIKRLSASKPRLMLPNNMLCPAVFLVSLLRVHQLQFVYGYSFAKGHQMDLYSVQTLCAEESFTAVCKINAD